MSLSRQPRHSMSCTLSTSAPDTAKLSLAHVPWLAALAFLIGVACNTATLSSTPTIAAPRSSTPAPSLTMAASTATTKLATPVSQEPAAGICGSVDGAVVEFRIEPGIPDPRCARVRPDQHLKVMNKTDGPLDLVIGTFSFHLEPGDEFTIEVPFGEYLAPGVHLLQVLPCCGPEFWLEGGSD